MIDVPDVGSEDVELTAKELADAAADLRGRFLARVAAANAAAESMEPDQEPARSHLSLLQTLPDDVDGTAIPETIGRYRIINRLGAGGMGVVYAAHDDALDRNLAIKVLGSHIWDVSGRRRERLLREAQAMAKVTHPNLVTVHEVGTSDDQLFVAMEFVPGPTLERWLVTEIRSWQDVVVVFRQITIGLTALHAAGLVHRDVKPANVIVGDDGRVRVLDLGLVGIDRNELTVTDGMWAWSSSLSRVDQLLTKTGDRLGTPAYMSPEQFLRQKLTPASDVFSLCITFFEALYGRHPFMAETFEELRDNVLEERIAPPPSNSVPSWLHDLVIRGLAFDPSERPSMQVFTDALAKDRALARRRWMGIAAVVAVAAAINITLAEFRSIDHSPSCDAGAATIATVWNESDAHEIRTAMADTRLPYAEELADRIISGLDDYAQEWARAHNTICIEHAAGHHSAQLLDTRMACMDRRRQALATTVALISNADVGVVEHAGDMLAKLPRLDSCGELGELETASEIPPQHVEAVRRLETQLVQAQVLANAGLIDAADEVVRSVATEATSIGQPRVLTQALLAEASNLILLQHDPARTHALLDRALAGAIESGLDDATAEAMILRLYVRGLSDGQSEAALADFPIAEALLARAGGDLDLQALLLNNLGAVRLAAGDREGAQQAFARSLEVKEQLFGSDHLELALSLTNLSLFAPDEVSRKALHDRVIAIYESWLGPQHPRTLDVRLLAARKTTDPEAAEAMLLDLCPRLHAIRAVTLAGECEFELGRWEYARGRLDLAEQAMLAANTDLDPNAQQRSILDAYLGELNHDERMIAVTRERVAQSAADEAASWWLGLAQAEIRLLLAQTLLNAGDSTTAITTLEDAIAGLEHIDSGASTDRDRLLALARSALATALAGVGDATGRVASLRSSARSYFNRWPQPYVIRLRQLDSLNTLN